MATLTVQEVDADGTELTFSAVAAGGDVFTNNGDTFLEIVNSSGANSYTVTIAAQKQVYGVDGANIAISVGTSERHHVARIPPQIYNNTSGQVALSYTGSAPATDLTVAVFKRA